MPKPTPKVPVLLPVAMVPLPEREPTYSWPKDLSKVAPAATKSGPLSGNLSPAEILSVPARTLIGVLPALLPPPMIRVPRPSLLKPPVPAYPPLSVSSVAAVVTSMLALPPRNENVFVALFVALPIVAVPPVYRSVAPSLRLITLATPIPS